MLNLPNFVDHIITFTNNLKKLHDFSFSQEVYRQLQQQQRLLKSMIGRQRERIAGLTRAVLLRHQYLATGGGWQDQMGSLVSVLLDGIVHIVFFIHYLTC